MSAKYVKITRQFQPVGHRPITRIKAQSCLHLHRTAHDWRIGAHSQRKQVFDLRMIQQNVELYIVTPGGVQANDGAAGGERRVKERSLHGLKVRVAAGTVDYGMELSMQRDRMSAACNSKV